MNSRLQLIVGLGNPGAEYQDTRHNAGAWFVSALAAQQSASFRAESKFFGRIARIDYQQADIRLLLPDTYMNESGKSVVAVCHFFKIPPDEILIAHDEIDLPIGVIKLKQGGGLAGHNGLRDIARHLGNDQSFNRLRIGVGKPDHKEKVIGHVLSKASADDKEIIYDCIEAGLDVMPLAVKGEWQKAMNQLHNLKRNNSQGTPD